MLQKIIIFLGVVLIVVEILFCLDLMIDYSITMSSVLEKVKAAVGIKPCVMPPGWKIITNGKEFSWEDDTGFRSVTSDGTPARACEFANSYYEYANATKEGKKDWKYLDQKGEVK